MAIKPCEFNDGTGTHCKATEQDECKGWVPSDREQFTDERITHYRFMANQAKNRGPSITPYVTADDLIELMDAMDARAAQYSDALRQISRLDAKLAAMKGGTP